MLRNMKKQEDKMEKKIMGPLFVIGCPRSGTTMLNKILSSHSRIKNIIGESNFYDRIYLNRNLLRKFSPKKREHFLIDYLSDRKRRKKTWKCMNFESWLKNYKKLKGKNYADLYLALMLTFAEDYYGDNTTNYYIGDKDPRPMPFGKFMLKIFPEAKIINIERDGRAVVSSLMEFRGKDIVNHTLLWKYHIRTSLRFNRKMDKKSYLKISYESFVKNPEEELIKICDFLNLDYEKEMLKANLKGLSSFTNKTEKVDISRIDRYKKELNQKQIKLIEYIAFNELKQLGYVNKDKKKPVLPLKIRLMILLAYERYLFLGFLDHLSIKFGHKIWKKTLLLVKSYYRRLFLDDIIK